jgi:hypothetical protein
MLEAGSLTCRQNADCVAALRMAASKGSPLQIGSQVRLLSLHKQSIPVTLTRTCPKLCGLHRLNVSPQVAVGLAGLAIGYQALFRQSTEGEHNKADSSALGKAAAAGTAAVAPGAAVASPGQPCFVDLLDRETKNTSGRYWK